GRASRYTATRRPHTLAAAWEVPTHTDARKLEARIKQLTRSEKLRLTRGAPLEGPTPARSPSPAPQGGFRPWGARAFIRGPEKIMRAGVRERAIAREPMKATTDPGRADERAHARRDAILL